MKKAICIMIIGTLLICTFFVGCGKAENGKVSDTSTAENNNSTNAAESIATDASENLSSVISEISSDVSDDVSDMGDDMTSTTKK